MVHTNFFYIRILDDDSYEYCPAEIAVAEFSLKEGVTRVYHRIIKSKIRMGYASEAIEHSKNTHQIPKEHNFNDIDYKTIYEEILRFVSSSRENGKLPPIYTQYWQEKIYCPASNIIEQFMFAASKSLLSIIF